MADASHKNSLMEQLKQLRPFKYDMIELCKPRTKHESRTRWKDTGDELTIRAGGGQHYIGGVGFIISKQIASQAIEVEIHSQRISTLKLNIG